MFAMPALAAKMLRLMLYAAGALLYAYYSGAMPRHDAYFSRLISTIKLIVTPYRISLYLRRQMLRSATRDMLPRCHYVCC